MVTKEKGKKSGQGRNTSADHGSPGSLEKTLYLQARVLCASDPSKKVLTCMGCIQREVNVYCNFFFIIIIIIYIYFYG